MALLGKTPKFFYNAHHWPRGVVVNMSPCHGEDRRFDSGRGRQE